MSTATSSALHEATIITALQKEADALNEEYDRLAYDLACVSSDYKVAMAAELAAEKSRNQSSRSRIGTILSTSGPGSDTRKHVFDELGVLRVGNSSESGTKDLDWTAAHYERFIQLLERRFNELSGLIRSDNVLRDPASLRNRRFACVRSCRAVYEVDLRIVKETVLRRKIEQRRALQRRLQADLQAQTLKNTQMSRQLNSLISHKKTQLQFKKTELQSTLKWKNREADLSKHLKVLRSAVKAFDTMDAPPQDAVAQAADVSGMRVSLSEVLRVNVGLQERLSCALASKEAAMKAIRDIRLAQRRQCYQDGSTQYSTQLFNHQMVAQLWSSGLKESLWTSSLPGVQSYENEKQDSPALTFLAHSNGNFVDECLREVVGAATARDVSRFTRFLANEVALSIQRAAVLEAMVVDTCMPFWKKHLGPGPVLLHACDIARQSLGCSRVVFWIIEEEEEPSGARTVARALTPTGMGSQPLDGSPVEQGKVHYEARVYPKVTLALNGPGEDLGCGLLGRAYKTRECIHVPRAASFELGTSIERYPDVSCLYPPNSEERRCRSLRAALVVPLLDETPSGRAVTALMQALAYDERVDSDPFTDSSGSLSGGPMSPVTPGVSLRKAEPLPFPVDPAAPFEFPTFTVLYLSAVARTLRFAIHPLQESDVQNIRQRRSMALIDAFFELQKDGESVPQMLRLIRAHIKRFFGGEGATVYVPTNDCYLRLENALNDEGEEYCENVKCPMRGLVRAAIQQGGALSTPHPMLAPLYDDVVDIPFTTRHEIKKVASESGKKKLQHARKMYEKAEMSGDVAHLEEDIADKGKLAAMALISQETEIHTVPYVKAGGAALVLQWRNEKRMMSALQKGQREEHFALRGGGHLSILMRYLARIQLLLSDHYYHVNSIIGMGSEKKYQETLTMGEQAMRGATKPFEMAELVASATAAVLAADDESPSEAPGQSMEGEDIHG